MIDDLFVTETIYLDLIWVAVEIGKKNTLVVINLEFHLEKKGSLEIINFVTRTKFPSNMAGLLAASVIEPVSRG